MGRSMQFIYWPYMQSNLSGGYSLGKYSGNIMGFSKKSVNEFKLGFDE